MDAAGNVDVEIRVLRAIDVETGEVREAEPANGRAANENLTVHLNGERIGITHEAGPNNTGEGCVKRAIGIQTGQTEFLLSIDILENTADHDAIVCLKRQGVNLI